MEHASRPMVDPVLIWGPLWSVGIATVATATTVATTTTTVPPAAVVVVIAIVVVDALRSRWSSQWILRLGWQRGSRKKRRLRSALGFRIKRSLFTKDEFSGFNEGRKFGHYGQQCFDDAEFRIQATDKLVNQSTITNGCVTVNERIGQLLKIIIVGIGGQFTLKKVMEFTLQKNSVAGLVACK
jgi:hypothetical protein